MAARQAISINDYISDPKPDNAPETASPRRIEKKSTASSEEIPEWARKLIARVDSLEAQLRSLWQEHPPKADGLDENGDLWVGGRCYQGFTAKEQRILRRLANRKWVRYQRVAEAMKDDKNSRHYELATVESAKQHLNKKLRKAGCPLIIRQRKEADKLQMKLDLSG